MKRFAFVVGALLLVPAVALASETAEGSGSHLGIPDVAWKTLNLVVFLGLLVWLLFKPLSKYFASRGEGIREAQAKAQERREHAARMATSLQERVAELERDIAAAAERASEDAEREHARIVTEGESEAKRLLEQATDEIDNRLRVAKRELRAHAAELATGIAAERLEREIGETDRTRMFDRSLELIASEPGPGRP